MEDRVKCRKQIESRLKELGKRIEDLRERVKVADDERKSIFEP
ncbi:MAG: hypothetical protein Kow0099_06640 [Candidatus Abyssubacteria bacterium]